MTDCPLPPDAHYTTPEGYAALLDWYARGLADLRLTLLPDTLESRCIATPYGTTHVLLAGSPDAPPLLALHGINVNALNWRQQIRYLAPHYRLIVPDVPGYAGRSAAQRLPYHTDAFARWQLALLDTLGIERAVVAGSSGGGYFALQLAAYAPSRVNGVILVNPCGLCRYPLPYDLFRWQPVADLVGAFGRGVVQRLPGGARWLAGKSASPDIPPDPSTVELAALLLRYFRRSSPPGVLPAARLAQITAPVLLLLGEREPYFNLATLQRAAWRTLTAARLTVQIIPGGGHDLHNDQGEQVSQIIRAWLDPAVTR